MIKKSEMAFKSQGKVDNLLEYLHIKRKNMVNCPYLEESQAEFCNTGGNKKILWTEDMKHWVETYCRNKTKFGNFKKCVTYKAQLRREKAPAIMKIFALIIPILVWLHIVTILLALDSSWINDSIITGGGTVLSIIAGIIFSMKA